MDITWRGSPNFTRGRPAVVDRIVIHWFGTGTLESADARFQNKTNQVSAHYGVSKGRIWQWVREEDIAYHAGNWQINQRSVGIEHDATVDHPLSDDDYQLTASLVAQIALRHDIPLDRAHIVGHREIKPTQCPGSVDIDRIIMLAKANMDVRLKLQLVFNNQYPEDIVSTATSIYERMRYLSGGQCSLEFLPPLQTNFKDIPTRVFMQPVTNEEDMAVEKDWFIDNVYALTGNAPDLIVFIGKPGDWQNEHNGRVTFGHYYSEFPATLPALIQIISAEADWSWKWPTLTAWTHYITHEISHVLFQTADQTDRTHELDYQSKDGLLQALPTLDYRKINEKLAYKSSYERNPLVFVQKKGDPTVFLVESNVAIPWASSWQEFKKWFPNSPVPTISADDFLKFRIPNKAIKDL